MTSFSRLALSGLATLSFFLSAAHSARAAKPTLFLSPSAVTTPLESQFSVAVDANTDGYSAGGIGTILRFNPLYLSAVSVHPGTIFADYPLASIDNNSGKVAISGIAASSDQLFNGSGIFATVTFTAKMPGNTTISIEFTPGSTTDSNIAVAVGNGDVLSAVNTTSVLVQSAAAPTSKPSLLNPQLNFAIPELRLKESFDSLLASLRLPFFHGKYATVRPGRVTSQALDPLEPLVAQAPITDPVTSQPFLSVNEVATPDVNLLQFGIFATFAVLGIVLLYFLFKYFREKSRLTSGF